ncbi:xylulose kinase [Kosmotoga arenicorallina S304]|uniref:Xylulose kinase n=1 Tax=Kosmotoga arenicorallina S304 TaxID=1453497 RepID=A0A176K3U9_9BACT|nr:xylulokinase [Kosmotoga arenicorallina]OAA31692.1 xylulose kinase [Kosmotoga arenicorallina S304]
MLFAGIDVGTSSVKAILVDNNGNIVAKKSVSLSLQTPRPGWSEQDPNEWWSATVTVLKEVIAEAREPISTLAVSGQMHSLVVLDSSRRVLHPSILWCDQRTKRQCEELTDRYGGEEKVIKALGNPILTGFTAPKILWMKENESEIYQRARYFMLPKDFIIFKLTGSITTEPSDASGTSIYSPISGKYDEKILDILGIDERRLPAVISSGEAVGKINAMEFSELSDTVVVQGGADNAAAAYGCGVETSGDTMVSLGTSGTVVTVLDKPVADFKHGVHLFNHVKKNVFYHMAVILSATNSLNWTLKRFSINMPFSEIEKMASSKNVGANGVIFLPYLNGERTPHRNPSARGVFFGLSSFNDTGDLLRAVYEGVAYALRDGYESILKLGDQINMVKIVGGGSKSKLWPQIISDNFNKAIQRISVDEGAAYGVARLAAESHGVNTSNWIKITDSIKPYQENAMRYNSFIELYRKLYTSLKERFQELDELYKEG